MNRKKSDEKTPGVSTLSYEELCAVDLEKSVHELEGWYLKQLHYNKRVLQGQAIELQDSDVFQGAVQRVWNVADTLKILGRDRVKKEIDLTLQAHGPIDNQGDLEWEGTFWSDE